ncbi:MAG TPA: small ribosomal subunit Rsm22 family protein [Pseudobdellovibrionaceae bacterium]|jgi:ribosomal protein RSM22 (predicted rRNA methylase)
MQRIFTFPPQLAHKIEKILRVQFQIGLQDSKKIAEAVKKLSDYFIQNPLGSTPWNESWAQIAYLCYFLPLNHARAQAVVKEAEFQKFFEGLTEVIDFGSGPGTASLALTTYFNKFTMIEKAKEICSRLEFLPAQQTSWAAVAPTFQEPQKTLAVFSYSLTELRSLPTWTKQIEALMIIEPATQEDGRKLLELRQELVGAGYSIWAPCTHQGPCPLLTQSKNDWCHDRIHFDMPKWLEEVESYLPMKNRTLTMSYLLARRRNAPPRNANLGRSVGDYLKEKGKDRQMFCRSSEREFLTWMHKTGLHQETSRGVLVEIPEDTPKVSNELRLKSSVRTF